MATLRTRTVGPGRDYTSLAAWEAGEQADLVALDEIRQAECYAFEDTNAVDIDGWTTDATRYIDIYSPAGERHTGKWDATKYRIRFASTGTFAIFVRELDVRIRYIQIYVDQNLDTAWGITFDAGDNRCILYGCIIRGTTGAFANRGVQSRAGSKFINCVAYNWSASGFRQSGATSGFVHAYNCTAYNCADGFDTPDNGCALIVKNCLAANCTSAFTAGWNWHADCTNNATNNAVANTGNGGANNPPPTNRRVSQTFSFVDAANGDFHLQAGDTGALGFGADLSADAGYAFTDDIDGQTRTGTWDIGADEYVAAGGSTYDQTIALAASGNLTDAGAMSFAQSVALAVADALDQSGRLSMDGSTGLGVSGGISDVGPLSVSLSQALASIAGLSSLGGLAYAQTVGLALAAVLNAMPSTGVDAGISLDGQAGLTGSGPLALALAQALSTTAGLSPSSALVLQGLVNAAVAASSTPQAQQTLSVLQSLGVVSNLSALGGFSIVSTVTLDSLGTVSLTQVPGLFITLALGASGALSVENRQAVAAQAALAIQASIEQQSQQIASSLVSLGVEAATAQTVALIFSQALTLSTASAMTTQGTVVDGSIGNVMVIVGEILKRAKIINENYKAGSVSGEILS